MTALIQPINAPQHQRPAIAAMIRVGFMTSSLKWVLDDRQAHRKPTAQHAALRQRKHLRDSLRCCRSKALRSNENCKLFFVPELEWRRRCS